VTSFTERLSISEATSVPVSDGGIILKPLAAKASV